MRRREEEEREWRREVIFFKETVKLTIDILF